MSISDFLSGVATTYIPGQSRLSKWMVKAMLKKNGVPAEQIDMILGLMEKDPELFKKIADEIQAEVKKGKSQQDAAMYIMPKYQSRLQQLMKK